MATAVTERDEQVLLDAVKRAVALVDDEGVSPNAAITKIASDEGFRPGYIQLVCAAYNTGRQTDQRLRGGGILDKLASFTLADAAEVTAKVYGASEKAAAYAGPPTWVERQAILAKQRQALPFTKAAAAEITLTPETAMDRAYSNIDRAKRACAELSRRATLAADTVRHHVADLVGYFRKSASLRLPFVDVERVSLSNLQAPSSLFDIIYKQAHLREPRVLQRGTDKQPIKFAVDLGAEPFTLVQSCLRSAAQAAYAQQALAAAHTKLAEAKEDALRPFRDCSAPPPTPIAALIAGGGPWSEKAAGVFSTPAMGAMVGTMLSRGIGDVPKTKDGLVEDAWLDLEDPQHLNELRKIKAQTMLNGMLTDHDDPISGHDPDKVLNAYNELAQMAPRLAEQPAALKPVLRRRLAGTMEPFEAKELTDIEKGLAQSRMPTPNTTGLSDAPGSLLG